MLKAHKYQVTERKIYTPRRSGALDLVTPASYYMSVKLQAVMGVLCVPQMIDGTDGMVVVWSTEKKNRNAQTEVCPSVS